MDAKRVNNSHRSLFLSGGRLDAALFGATQIDTLADESTRRREQYGRPTTECWQCGEMRPDDTEVCPTCDADAVAFQHADVQRRVVEHNAKISAELDKQAAGEEVAQFQRHRGARIPDHAQRMDWDDD